MTMTLATKGEAVQMVGLKPPRQRLAAGESIGFRVARTIREVVAAWRVVYEVYVRSGFISPNPYFIHTNPQSLTSSSAVFESVCEGRIESTLTAIVDGSRGLPLDSVYADELDALRQRGRRLTEYGLFAHVRQLGPLDDAMESSDDSSYARASVARVQSSVVYLMRLAFYFAISRNSTDFVVGVHPRHARFYERGFGFRQIGEVRTYATVNDRPVVLLHADLETSLRLNPTPFALDYCLNNPVPVEDFEDRCAFSPHEISQAPVSFESYLRVKYPGWESRDRRRRRAG